MCKIAFVFDTNFIIENRNLIEVVANLSTEFTVYVTQVSIDERISQKYLELKKKYEKLAALAEEYRNLASISMTRPFDMIYQAEREFTQQGYVDLFGEHIISFSLENEVFTKVLDRVFKKVPPFSSADGASDKGFKDTLIWLSLLEYFKSKGEDDVVFITNDKGFRNNADALCKEFKEYTGKTIELKDSSYYYSRLEVKASDIVASEEDGPLPDVNQIREKIHEVIESLCGVYSQDYWGEPEWNRTFTLSQRVDGDYVEYVFTHLKQDIKDNLFETAIPADKILGLDGRVTNEAPIPISAWEDALSLYEDIKQKLPQYLPQFYSAAATIINKNYFEPKPLDEENDDIPF